MRYRRRLIAIIAAALLAVATLVVGVSAPSSVTGRAAVPASVSGPTEPVIESAAESAPSSAPAPRIPAAVNLIGPGTAHVQDAVEVVGEVRTTDGLAVLDASVTTSIVGVNAGAVITCVPTTCRTDDRGTITVRYAGVSTGSDSVDIGVPDGTGGTVTASTQITWHTSIRGNPVALLGDSFSTGEGTGNYVSGTDIPGVNGCHRSAHAYGAMLAGVGHDVAFRACSGAITADFLAANAAGNQLANGQVEPGQLCSAECPDPIAAAVGPDTRSVAFSIGGNDAGFSSVLASCIWVSELHLNYGRPGRGCRSAAGLDETITKRLAGLGGTAADVPAANGRTIVPYATLLSRIHALGPDAQVYVVGYPRLFQPGNQDCYLGRVDVAYAGRQLSVAAKITPDDARWLDDKSAALGALERQAVAAAGPWAHFVDPTAAFADHGVCGSASWINGLSGTLTVHSVNDIDAQIDAGSFHPNLTGQQGLAAALSAAGFSR